MSYIFLRERGGGILGGQLLGHTCVCAVEIEPYCQQVLLQRQRDGILPRFPIWDDVRTFDGKPWRGKVDVICGGFPCQDISCAGKGAGIDGERSGLWREFARVIGEIRPKFAFVENSPMLAFRGLGRVLGDLSELGYDAQWCVMGADDVGAPHRRKRMWILAHARHIGGRDNFGGSLERNGKRQLEAQERTNATVSASRPSARAEIVSDQKILPHAESVRERVSREQGEVFATNGRPNGLLLSEPVHAGVGDGEENISDPYSARQPRRKELAEKSKWLGRGDTLFAPLWWQSDPADADGAFKSQLGRVANGVANRLDRLKAIGNGQVPLVAAKAFKLLMQQMKGEQQ